MKSFVTRNWSTISIILLVISAVWIWFSRVDPLSTQAGSISAPQKGFPAPDFSLDSNTGKTITLSSLRGQPVLINLWASWCSPCRAEMPAIQRVYEDYQNKGLQILAVNTTHQDDPNAALDFANELGLTFPILFDKDGSVSRLYQLGALPSSYFIGKDGVIQEIVVGGPMSEALLRVRIEQLLESNSHGQP